MLAACRPPCTSDTRQPDQSLSGCRMPLAYLVEKGGGGGRGWWGGTHATWPSFPDVPVGGGRAVSAMCLQTPTTVVVVVVVVVVASCSVDMNHSAAMSNLGIIYKNGEGVEQNYTTAIALFARSAAMNTTEASSGRRPAGAPRGLGQACFAKACGGTLGYAGLRCVTL